MDMARVTQVNRRGGLSQNSQAGTKARRGRGRTARAQRGVVAAATSGLELLESRVMMSAVRPDAAFTTGDLLIGDDKSFPTTGSAGFSLGFSAPINFFGNLYNGVFVNNNGNVS